MVNPETKPKTITGGAMEVLKKLDVVGMVGGAAMMVYGYIKLPALVALGAGVTAYSAVTYFIEDRVQKWAEKGKQPTQVQAAEASRAVVRSSSVPVPEQTKGKSIWATIFSRTPKTSPTGA